MSADGIEGANFLLEVLCDCADVEEVALVVASTGSLTECSSDGRESSSEVEEFLFDTRASALRRH